MPKFVMRTVRYNNVKRIYKKTLKEKPTKNMMIK